MRRAPALHTHGKVTGARGVQILKIVRPDEQKDWPYGRTLILSSDRLELTGAAIRIANLREPDAFGPGDVIRVREGSGQISVLWRRGSLANTLFVTEMCNSLCLMCSQPPRDENDDWRIDELLDTIGLVDRNERQLGFTGGEPTLLGGRFVELLSACRETLPDTHLHVLTNGRLLSDPEPARAMVEAGGDKTVWAVPLYADIAAKHDEIVAAPGAFHETLAGLAQLALLRARVEIRVVLHALSTPRLPQLASYLYRRMPFVEHVAFMGLEPMGLARSNRARLWIDPADYAGNLGQAVHHLHSRGMNVSIYNLPLCVLPEDLRPFARQSISDWKNVVDDPACNDCGAASECAGFFLSADKTWRSRAIRPLNGEELKHELA